MAELTPKERVAQALLGQAMADDRPPGSTRLPPPPGLAELKAMYANGMITREEFYEDVERLPKVTYPAASQDVPLPTDQMPSGKRFKRHY